MADMPKELLEQIKVLEDLFTVDQKKLKEIVEHFVKELTKGEQSLFRDAHIRVGFFFLSDVNKAYPWKEGIL